MNEVSDELIRREYPLYNVAERDVSRFNHLMKKYKGNSGPVLFRELLDRYDMTTLMAGVINQLEVRIEELEEKVFDKSYTETKKPKTFGVKE